MKENANEEAVVEIDFVPRKQGLEQFSQSVRASAERTSAFLVVSRSAAPATTSQVRAALGELRMQHEELLVAEEELRAQLDELGQIGRQVDAERERYVDLFDHAPDVYVVTDLYGVIRDANIAAIELFRLQMRFIKGKPLSAFAAPGDLRRMNDALDRLAPHTDTMRTTLNLTVHPRGGGGPIDVTASVSYTSQRRRLLWLLRPAPKRVLMPPHDANDDQSSAAPAAAVSRAALLRTLEDKEDLLRRERRSREELERVNRSKDRFIAVLSHDLRAPLNAILGWTQMLRREVLDHNTRGRALETIERNAHLQAHLIEELLDISRIAADRIQLSLAPLPLGPVVRQIVESTMHSAAEARIELRAVIEPDLVVMADRERLEQMLGNIVANALKFTPAEGRITIEARNAPADGHEMVSITVRDTGAGIAPDLLPYIFDMYTHNQRLNSRSGLGVGLYIVKQLVGLQNGTVSAASEGIGKGATFTVRLRAATATATAPTTTAPPAATTTPTTTPTRSPPAAAAVLRGLRILIIGDDEETLDLMAAILRRAGADVACARSERDARELFGRWMPDVIVGDLGAASSQATMTERLTALERLIAELRDRDASIATLAVSPSVREDESSRILSGCFDGHIQKPIDGRKLVKGVLHVARNRVR